MYRLRGSDAVNQLLTMLAVVVFTAVPGSSQSAEGRVSQPYAPAYYSWTQGEPPQLVVFPAAGGQMIVPLALPGFLRFSTFTPDGRAIFATMNTITSPRTPAHPARLGPPRLIRVDLGPVRITAVADLVGLDDVLGLVVAPGQDKILFTGVGWRGSGGCDLFEIDASGGNFKMLLPNFGCGIGGISPDGRKMLVQRDLGLAIVDLATGATVQLGTGLWKGAWSPDGKWIAALYIPPPEQRRRRASWTIRIDAHDFSQRRDMGGEGDTEVSWSPDSRYLLYSEWTPPCPHRGAKPSLITMDIETAKRVIVKESRCKIDGNWRIGWVSLDAVQ
jgi:Tol biopolymer transport system component